MKSKNFWSFMVLALGLLILSGCTQIDTGNVGVERSFGKVNPQTQPQGVYLTVLDSLDEFTTKEVSFPVSNLTPKSQDNLTLKDFDADVYFKANPSCIATLYTKYQGDFVRHSDIVEGGQNVNVIGYNRVLRAAREATYNAVAGFPATTMHTKRPEIAEAIRSNLQKELETSDKGCFTVTSINVRNLLTDPAIELAIQGQVAMDQEITKKKKEKELAEAEAARLLAVANGEANANRVLAASLSPEVMQIRMAEIQRDTIVQSAKAGNTIISGAGVTPVMQIK